ncbi:MAG: signal recognition particle receptor subunit alpha, partial [Verrucomicrobiia bacterium]
MGLFDKFKAGLQRTQAKLSHEINRIVSRSPKLDDDTLEEIEYTLISADLGLPMTQRILAAIKDSYESQGKEGLDVLAVARREVVSTFNDEIPGLNRQAEGLTVVSLVGVNGTGKTTTAAKLAHRVQASGDIAMLAACDTFRAAAVEQLKEWGGRLDVP